MIKAGIAGASGYMGGEVLRVLLDHPQVELAWISSRSPGAIEAHHPNLYGCGLHSIHPDDVTPCDIAFLALPTEASMQTASRLADMGCKIVDLGSAFRLKSRETWEAVYGMTHTHWPLVDQSVYGITELHAEEINQTEIVANPGCFASAAILGLAPLLKHGLVDEQKLVVNGLSGTAGAGAELSRAAHHPEIGNNAIAYNVVNHRHTYEMEQELSTLASQKVHVHFTPVYIPIVRGILDVCFAFPKKPVARQALLELYKDFYHAAEFVKIYDMPGDTNASWQYKPYPWINAVIGTNYCYIGLDVDETRGRIAIFSVLDSLGKGGAQVGVENLNLMFGLDRAVGLKRRGLHPI